MATVQGTIRKASTEALESPVIFFETLSAPVALSSYVVSVSVVECQAEEDGTFEQELEAGDYRVRWFNGRNETVLLIAVPATDATYQFNDLITSDLTYTYTTAPAYMLKTPVDGGVRFKDGWWQFYNTDTGKWHTPRPVGAEGSVRWAWSAGED